MHFKKVIIIIAIVMFTITIIKYKIITNLNSNCFIVVHFKSLIAVIGEAS